MWYAISIILLIFWLLGFAGGYTMRGFIHILLVAAVVIILLNTIQGWNELTNSIEGMYNETI